MLAHTNTIDFAAVTFSHYQNFSLAQGEGPTKL
jgi:hypothetical protein